MSGRESMMLGEAADRDGGCLVAVLLGGIVLGLLAAGIAALVGWLS